jgi:nucleoside-diphosphate-sugar epimerase
VWGDGEQTRSFLYIAECVEGSVRLMRSGVATPLNIGSEEMVTINQLLDLVADIAGKQIAKKHIPGPQGVRGRNSDNWLIRKEVGWAPTQSLRAGLEATYQSIEAQVRRNVRR